MQGIYKCAASSDCNKQLSKLSISVNIININNAMMLQKFLKAWGCPHEIFLISFLAFTGEQVRGRQIYCLAYQGPSLPPLMPWDSSPPLPQFGSYLLCLHCHPTQCLLAPLSHFSGNGEVERMNPPTTLTSLSLPMMLLTGSSGFEANCQRCQKYLPA